MTPRTIELTDRRALRGLAQPARLSLVGLLRREGPLTATPAGERIGESATTSSFHLRQLVRNGLVEEAGGGRGRKRPWHATATFTSWPGLAESPVQAPATELLSTDALVEPLLVRQQQPELRPEGSRPVMLIDLAFPTGE